MTTQQSLPVAPVHHYVTWTWGAIGLTPVMWVAGLVGGFAAGEGAGEGTGAALLGLLGILLMVAAPTVAVMLATDAELADQPSSRSALVVAVIALVATLAVMPILLTGWLGTLIAAALVVVALAIFAWVTYRRRR